MSGFMVNFGLECTCLFVPCHQHIQKGKFLWLRWRVTAVEFIKDELRSECCGTTGWVSSVYLSQSIVHECSSHTCCDWEQHHSWLWRWLLQGKDKFNQDVGLAEPKRDYIDLTLFNDTDLLQLDYNKFLYSLTCICMLMWKSKVKWNSLMKPDEESSQKVTKFLPIYYQSQKSINFGSWLKDLHIHRYICIDS